MSARRARLTPTRRARGVDAAVRRWRGSGWRGVAVEGYRTGAPQGRWAAVARHVLAAGSRGAPLAFDVRYFEIAPGGCSGLERHRHAHVVIVLRGAGHVRLGTRWRRLSPLDLCWIGPNVPHQLRNATREPFGFLCVVDAERDAGRAVRAPAG
jgi:ribulose-bisphosphate carboxylase large chain